MPLSVPLEEPLAEVGIGATNSEATREAAPIFLEREAMFCGLAMVLPVRGTWKVACAA